MSTQAKHTGISQRHRANPSKGVARESALQRKRNTGADFAALAGVGLPAVKLKSKMAFDVDDKILQGYNKNKIYTDIEAIAKKYYRMCREKFIAPNPDLPLSNRIAKVFEGMKQLLKSEFSGINLSLLKDDLGNSYFEAYYHYEMPDYTCFAMPLQILEIFERTGNPLYEYLLGIYGMLMNYPEFTDWQDDSIYNYIATEMMPERANEIADDDEEAASRMLSDHEFYMSGGEAVKYLRKIYGQHLTAKQIGKLRKLKVHYTEIFLKQWIINGYELLSSRNRQKIESLQNEEEFENTEDGDPVDLQRLFIICWNNDDEIVGGYIESIQMDAQEFGSYSPVERYRPDKAAKPYKHNNWFDLFLNWLPSGITEILSICERENKKANGEPDRED